jgi:hypothetical protein
VVPVNGLPELVVSLAGQVSIDLVGKVGIANGRLTNLFDGIPDVPLARFELRVTGGPGGLLRNSADICGPAAATTADAVFLAHSGASHAASVPLSLLGCPPPVAKPSGSVKLRFKGGRGALSGHFKAGSNAPALRTIHLRLPQALAAPGPQPGRLVSAYADGKRLARKAIRVKGRRLTLTAPDARDVKLRWRGLTTGPTVLANRPRLTFVTRLTDAVGTTTRLRLRARPSVARQ